MSIFAIGDLHLPGGDKKPMDVFGAHWERHFERICADWQSRVKPEDIVLIPGDISWAMQLGDALNDLREIAKLPGTILLLRGNHDYWWSSLSQLRACLPENMHAVQNDAFDAGDCVFCGTRGWTIPLGQNAAAQDEKLYRREALRLEMSLKDAARIANGRPIFAMMHYPPLLPETVRQGTEFTRLLSAGCDTIWFPATRWALRSRMCRWRRRKADTLKQVKTGVFLSQAEGNAFFNA